MERVTGELRRIEDLKAAGLVNDAEYAALSKKVSDRSAAGRQGPVGRPFCERSPQEAPGLASPFRGFSASGGGLEGGRHQRQAGDVPQHG